ncbi:MAG: SDR family NAD(P)-dependent oxidoreductase [Limisphaerales bacterium]
MRTKILITGISSGIGLGLAQTYLERGADVYGVSRRPSEKLSNYPNFTFQSIDLENLGELKNVCALCLPKEGKFDLVILNAGVHGPIGDVNEIDLVEFFSVMNVNTWANKVLLDSLFHLGSTIKQVAAISSHAGTHAFRGSAPYCMSKAALNMLMALYATEKPKTHFSAIAPPLVDTAIQDYLTAFPSDPRFAPIDHLKFAKETGRMLSPEAAAEILIKAFQTALTRPSGTFVDASGTQSPSLFQEASNGALKKNQKEPGIIPRRLRTKSLAGS